MIEKELQGLGLTKGEANAYLAMLELGSSTVGPIAKKAGISYSKIYEVLQRLIDKGIVSFIVRDKTRYYRAVEPSFLVNFLDRQELEIEKNRKKLNEIIPELEKHLNSGGEKQEAEIFVGAKGIRTANEIMFDGAKRKDSASFFYVYKENFSEVINEFYYGISSFYKNKGILFKGIGSKEWVRSEYVKKTKSYIDARYVDFPLPGTIDIYKDFVLEVSWGEKPVGILIHSKEIADNYRNYFDEVWKQAKK